MFTRKGDDILIDLPIGLAEAVLGANTGTVLRLKGKGAPDRAGGHGDEYVTLKLTLPDAPERGPGAVGIAMEVRCGRRLGAGGGGVKMEIRSYLIEAQFDARAVDRWIEAGWLLPLEGDQYKLSDIDLARARLIFDLTASLGVNDGGVPVILDLIDQIHGLRRAIRNCSNDRGHDVAPSVEALKPG